MDIFRKEIELLKEEINSMNSRMDSFVQQITETKRVLYSQADDAINKITAQGDNHYDRINNKLEEIKEFESLKEDLSENKDFIKKLKKELNDNFKLKDELKKTSSRLEVIEGYFEKYNLEVILQEINKIEEEYRKRINSVLSGISSKKGKNK